MMAGRPTVLVVDNVADIGGAQVTLLLLLKNLRERFKWVVVVPGRGRFTERLEELGIEYLMVPMSPLKVTRNPLRLSTYPFRYAFTAAAIAAVAKREGVACLHTNSLRAHLYGALAARLCCRPFIPHLQDFPANRWMREALRWSFRLADEVVVNSWAVKEVFAYDPKCYGKIRVIYPAIDREEFNLDVRPDRVRAEWGLEGCYPVVGIASQLVPPKGHPDFIRAAAEVVKRFPRAKFLVVGSAVFPEDGYEAELHALVRELGLGEHFIFTGFRRDMPQVMAAWDILVVASHVEPFGKVTIEAMALGKPVVATAVGGIAETIENGVSGLLVPPAHPQAMAEAIIDLAAHPHKAQRIAQAGYQRVQEMFTFPRYAQAFAALFERYCQEGVT